VSAFATLRLPRDPTAIAPDGPAVRVLLALADGSMARFALGPGQVAREEVVELEPGVCLTIPLGTHFQFRAAAGEGVAAIGVTLPPWPGADEAVFVAGPWAPSAG
jgi:hypothetical protein